MTEALYHRTTPEEHRRRKDLAPGIHDAFTSFSKAVFAEGAIDEKTKQLIAVAVAHTTQCPLASRILLTCASSFSSVKGTSGMRQMSTTPAPPD